MTKENLESTQLMKITGQRADLISMHDHEFSELVWENGQIFVQSLPRICQKSPSTNVHQMKKRFGTLDDSLHDKKGDLQLNLTRYNSLQENKHHESLYQTHFNMFLEHNEGNTCDNNLTDSQIVPVNEYANMQLGGSSKLREIPLLGSTRNSQHHDHSSQQQYWYQDSAPFKSPRVDSSTNQVLVGELSTSKLQEQDLEHDGKRAKVNLSLFLRSPVLDKGNSTQRNDVTVPTNSTTSSSRSKKLKNNGSGPSGDVDGGFGNPPTETNVEVPPPSAKPPKKSVSDDQSEAVCGDGKYTAKEKLINAEKAMEPRPVASSSFCSRGASNNPIYNNLKRRYHEDTEGSADLSDQNVEEKLENARKQVPSRGRAVSKRKRTAEIHNQSERKRRDKINKKMRVLQELIPNCNKVDKASMLDEAIEYLKTLQLQVQMMSMRTGVCIPQMMIPTGMQQIHAPQMAHFSPMGVGMGMRMHMGAVGCSPQQFLFSPIAATTAVPGMTQNRIQIPGFAAQALPPMSLFPSPPSLLHETIPVAGVSPTAGPVERMASAKLPDPKDPNQKSNYVQERNNAMAECSNNQHSI